MAVRTTPLGIGVLDDGRRMIEAGHIAIRDFAQRSPGQVLWCRAVSGLGIHRHANAGQSRHDEQYGGPVAKPSQTGGSRQITAADEEQGYGHDPPVGSGSAGQYAQRLADRAVRRRLHGIRAEPGRRHQDR